MNTCSICFEEIDVKHITITRCIHYFHMDCIQKWKNSNKNDCLVCRTQLDENNLEQYHLKRERSPITINIIRSPNPSPPRQR